jgi:thiamine biosynthesis protein ThiI
MLIVRHGEIYTKSDPVRGRWIQKLAQNIREALPDAKVRSARWRLFVDARDEKKAADALKRTFGVVSFSKIHETGADMEAMKKATEKYFVPLIRKGKTFGVFAQRLDKTFPITSPEIGREVGGYVNDLTGARVNLTKPDVPIYIEIYEGKALLFSEFTPGPGGLPVGTAGKMKAIVEDENSVLAAWMMMKRGVRIYPVCESKKAEKLVSKLNKWAHGGGLLGDDKGCLGTIVGETEPEAFVKKYGKAEQPVFAPLVGLPEKEIARMKAAV